MSKYRLDKSAQVVENQNYIMTQEEVCERLNDLEEKLAESEEQLLQKERKIEDLMLCEFVATTLDFNKLSADNCKLKQQLAEKDEEIRVAYSFRKQKCDNLQKALAEKEEEFMQVVKDWKSLVESKNQDKISFCIEKLEKVKEKFGYKYNSQLMVSSKGLCEYIDNQIASLKRGVE